MEQQSAIPIIENISVVDGDDFDRDLSGNKQRIIKKYIDLISKRGLFGQLSLCFLEGRHASDQQNGKHEEQANCCAPWDHGLMQAVVRSVPVKTHANCIRKRTKCNELFWFDLRGDFCMSCLMLP